MMKNGIEKFKEVKNTRDVLTIRAFLDNCILWDGLYKQEIEKYVEELKDIKINGEPIFQEDDGMDLSKFRFSEEDLARLSTESMFNFSLEKYNKRLEIASELSKIKEKELSKEYKTQERIIYGNESEGSDSVKKSKNVSISILIGAGALIATLLLLKMKR